MGYITPAPVMITYELPMAEVLLDFYDRLESASKELHASLGYQICRLVGVSPRPSSGVL